MSSSTPQHVASPLSATGQDPALDSPGSPSGAAPVPALESRQAGAFQPDGWCPPQWAPADLEILRRVRAALDRL